MIRLSAFAEDFLEKYEQEYITPPATIKTLVMDITGEYRFNIIAAPPSTGKSAYAMQNVVMLAQQGIYTIYFSYEMSAVAIFARILSHLGKLNKQDLEMRKIEPQKVRRVIQDNTEIFRYISIADSGTEKTIRQDIESIVKNPNITNLTLFLVFDYLQKIPMFQLDDPRISTEKTLNLVSKIMKDYNCSAYVISSMNRNGYEGGLDGARNSGQIEFDADTLIQMQMVKFDDKNTTWQVIDRKEYAREQAQDRSYIQVSVVKNRHGSGSQKVFLFDRPTQTFHHVTTIQSTQETNTDVKENNKKKIANF